MMHTLVRRLRIGNWQLMLGVDLYKLGTYSSRRSDEHWRYGIPKYLELSLSGTIAYIIR